MSDLLVRDDMLEAVLRSRAGDGAPADLRSSILAAVAADGPRVAVRRRAATGHPWRLLAVAAVLLGTVGAALFVGGSRQAVVTPPPSASVRAVVAPPPSASVQAVVPIVSASPTSTAGPSAVTVGSDQGQLAYIQGPADPLSGDPGDLYIANHDGSDPRLIKSTVDGLVGWSPSGRYLATYRGIPDEPTYTVTIITPDGKSVGTITPVTLGDVSWSPTQDQLLVAERIRDPKATLPHPRVAIYKPDGSLIRLVRTPPGVSELVEGMDWAPDGQAIVTGTCVGCKGDKYDDTPDLDWDLWILKADGSAPTRLTETPKEVEVSPRWSPDGSEITYWIACSLTATSCPKGSWLIRPDGSGTRRLLTDQSSLIWSPDGTRLLFERGSATDELHRNVFSIDSDGSDDTRVTNMDGENGPLLWSPDGRQILFMHYPPHPSDPTASVPSELWIAGSDGSDPRQLGTQLFTPAWQWTR
jgi:Tol biopolymer transport system component